MKACARVVLGLTAAMLAGCDTVTPVVRPDGAAQSIIDVVSKKTGFHPNDVSCPEGVPARVGTQFDCHYTGPEGKQYTASMRVTKLVGEAVDFDVNTHPTN